MRETLSLQCLGGLDVIYCYDTETDVVEMLLSLADTEGYWYRNDCAAVPLIRANLTAGNFQNQSIAGDMQFVGQTAQQFKNKTIVTTKFTDSHGLLYTHMLTLFVRYSVVEVVTSITNQASKPITIDVLSSFALGSLPLFSKGYAAEKLKIHFLSPDSTTKIRLISETADKLPLEIGSNLLFSSVESSSAHGYMPFCAIEDTAYQMTWAAAITHTNKWWMELSHPDSGLCLSGGLAGNQSSMWHKTLSPSKTFVMPKAALTAVRGGADAAIRELSIRYSKFPHAVWSRILQDLKWRQLRRNVITIPDS